MAGTNISVRLDDAIKKRARAVATADKRTLSNWVALVVEREVAAAEDRDRSEQEARK